MIDTLQSLCSFLSDADITVQETGTHLGTHITDQGGNLPLIIQPTDTSFASAEVVREFETQNPAHILLTIADSATLSVPELAASFGNFRQIPKMQPNLPTRIMFTSDIPGKPYTCALIAAIAPNTQDIIAQGNITSVIVRRDIRLD